PAAFSGGQNDERDARVFLFSPNTRPSPRRENDVDLESDELGGDLSIAFVALLRPSIFDRDGTALNPAEFPQALHKSGDPLARGRRRSRAQETDRRQLRRLLRPCRERPRRHRAAEQRDERAAATHSITSSASSRNGSGMGSPIDFAVLRVTTSSNCVGRSIGRSPGVAPLRILFTRPP